MQQRFINLHPKTKNVLQSMALESARDGAYRVSNRIKAILLNDDGKTSGEIADVLRAYPKTPAALKAMTADTRWRQAS